MTASALLGDLAARGVCLTVDGGELVVEGPGEVITPDLIARLRQHKPDILAALAPSPEWTADDWHEIY